MRGLVGAALRAVANLMLAATARGHASGLTARAWGVFAVADATDARQRLRGLPPLERAHLRATTNGIAVHHLNAITERADRERQLALPPHFGLAVAEPIPHRDVQPLVAFRLGYPTHSARRECIASAH